MHASTSTVNYKTQKLQIQSSYNSFCLVWLCLTSHRQRGHLETAPPFTVPCEGREAR